MNVSDNLGARDKMPRYFWGRKFRFLPDFLGTNALFYEQFTIRYPIITERRDLQSPFRHFGIFGGTAQAQLIHFGPFRLNDQDIAICQVGPRSFKTGIKSNRVPDMNGLLFHKRC